MKADSIQIAYFGKIPSHADFVRHNANGAATRAMDDWLQQGLYYAQTRGSDGFTGDRTYPFCFDPGDDASVLVGVIRPSRDSVGRVYPLLVGMEIDARTFDGRRATHVPALYKSFWEQANALARMAVAGHIDRHDLAMRVGTLEAQASDSTAESTYQRYLQQTMLTVFWERLWGYSEDSRKYLLFKNLLDVLLPLRSGIPPGYPLVLRFPLSPDGRLPAYDASIWLDVCLNLLDLPGVQCSFFWTKPDSNTGADPFLLLTLRLPQARTLAYLLDAEPGGETLCPLETMGDLSAVQAALSIPARYGELLEANHLSVWEFLQRLKG